MIGKTTPERLQYDTPWSRHHSNLGSLRSESLADSGERARVEFSTGVLSEMHELRATRRARGGRRPHFTPAERERVVELVRICLESKWTHREIAGALGLSGAGADPYIDAAQS